MPRAQRLLLLLQARAVVGLPGSDGQRATQPNAAESVTRRLNCRIAFSSSGARRVWPVCVTSIADCVPRRALKRVPRVLRTHFWRAFILLRPPRAATVSKRLARNHRSAGQQPFPLPDELEASEGCTEARPFHRRRRFPAPQRRMVDVLASAQRQSAPVGVGLRTLPRPRGFVLTRFLQMADAHIEHKLAELAAAEQRNADLDALIRAKWCVRFL